MGPIRVDFSYNLDPPIYPVIYDFNNNPPYVGQANHFQLFLQHRGDLLMTTMRIERWWLGVLTATLAICGCVARVEGQTAPSSQTQVQVGSAGQTAGPQGVELDRLVEVVNDDVILESDVDEERRLAAFQPFRDASRNTSRQEIIDRLIDRTLILQQARLQPEDEVTDQQVDEQLTALRKEIPACKQYHCETAEGWQKFVADQGFTMQELRRVWRREDGGVAFYRGAFPLGYSH